LPDDLGILATTWEKGLYADYPFRYVDDMALFADSKAKLWRWKRLIVDALAGLRLVLHENEAQAMPVTAGFPWLGLVIYPTHKRVKGRKVVQATRRMTDRFDAWRAGRISFAEFDASVQGWINHVRYADTWGLRGHLLRRFALGPSV
jgi:hypothetical protein